MGYRFVFTQTARSDIAGLDESVRYRLSAKLREYEDSGLSEAHVKKLQDHHAGEYRLRIGDYRLLMDKRGETFIVLRVRHRKDAYRG